MIRVTIVGLMRGRRYVMLLTHGKEFFAGPHVTHTKGHHYGKSTCIITSRRPSPDTTRRLAAHHACRTPQPLRPQSQSSRNHDGLAQEDLAEWKMTPA